MHTVLAGCLTAKFNVDGQHLHRYLDRRHSVMQLLCENLVLHDRILIPTTDYLTASGLVVILGEDNLIELLEGEQVKFIRLRNNIGYIRGEGVDGCLISFSDPNNRRPQSAPLDVSVQAGLGVLSGLKHRDRLQELIVQNSDGMETADFVGQINRDSIADLRQTSLWRDEYAVQNPDLVALPGVSCMQVRVVGEVTERQPDVIDVLLSVAQCNIELMLGRTFNCDSSATTLPLGGLVDLKLSRLVADGNSKAEQLWALCEVADVPNVGTIGQLERDDFRQFLTVVRGKNATAFRKWFHCREWSGERELYKEYVRILRDVPWFNRLPARAIRFAITTAAGFIPIVGAAAGAAVSALDTFVLDRLLRGKSPTFFIDDFRDFRSRIG